MYSTVNYCTLNTVIRTSELDVDDKDKNFTLARNEFGVWDLYVHAVLSNGFIDQDPKSIVVILHEFEST
jgi:hypothetical protein